MEKKKKGPVKVTTGAPAATKPNKKRYYPPKPKTKVEVKDVEATKVKIAEQVDTVNLGPTITATVSVPDEVEAFHWGVQPAKPKTWIQKVLAWLPFVERK